MEIAPSLYMRPATPKDARTLAELDKGAFKEEAWPLDAFQQALASPASDAQLAILDEKPVGYVLVSYREGVNVDSLAVAAEARGHQIGERLLLLGLERAAEKGAPAVTLQVEQGNTPAEKLYAKYGFLPTKILPGYYHGKDGTQMTLAELQSSKNRAFLAERHQQLLANLGSFPQSRTLADGS